MVSQNRPDGTRLCCQTRQKNLPWRKGCLSYGKDKKKKLQMQVGHYRLPYTSPAFGWKAKRLYSQ